MQLNNILKIYSISDAIKMRYLNNRILKIMRKQGTCCKKCGAVALEVIKTKTEFGSQLVIQGINSDGKEVTFTRDHIIPKSKGGIGIPNNYQVLCYDCNQNKGNKSNEEFFKIKGNPYVSISHKSN